MLHSLLEQKGIKYEDLNPDEKETLKQWEQALQQNQLTLEGVKDFVKNLIEAVEKELTELKETTSLWTFLFSWKRDFYLKARLKNYIMLYDFLSAPERAKKYIEQSLTNIK